jgi:hypothetical protein
MDFGVAITPNVSKRLSFGYASRNIDESIMGSYRSRSPAPAPGNLNAGRRTSPQRGVARTIRRKIRSRSALQLRTSPVSPLSASPVSSPEQDYQDYHREFRSSPGTPSTYQHLSGYYAPQTQYQNGGSSSGPRRPYSAVRQTTIDGKPLPPLPSFRLGQDLPWTSPTTTWIPLDNGESTYHETNSITVAPARGTVEDPQRTRELAELHEAMMAVDLGDDVWHPGGSWHRRPPPGPRDLGWAVAIPTGDEVQTGASREQGHREGRESPPPAYCSGQWGWDWEWEERGRFWVRGRPRRSTYYA